MKIFFRNIHLYLALIAGITIFISCLTGAILVFEKEFQTSIYSERYQVEPKGKRLSADELGDRLKKVVPTAKIAGIRIYSDPHSTVEIYFEDQKEAKHNKATEKKQQEKGDKKEHKRGGHDTQQTAYLNPYTGEVITYYNQKKAFFGTVLAIHRWLLIQPVGKTIMGISAIIFLFILITGIILWWPKNKKILQQRLTLKWSSWKRINHDLHIVIGFYSAIVLFVIALTGTAISFKWMSAPVFWLTSSDSKPPEPPASEYSSALKTISLQAVYEASLKHNKDAEFYNISAPKDAEGAYVVTILPTNAIHEKAMDQLFVDQYSGKKIGEMRFEDRNKGQKIRSFYLPIHMGTIGGIPGKIIAFLVCLAGISFPVTGTIMWLNRLKKKDKKSSKKFKKKYVSKELISQV
jgi:uncharacterized iron-regulated membrane protein